MNWLRICFSVLLVVTTAYAQNRQCGGPCSRVFRPVCARNGVGSRTFTNVCQMVRFNCLRRAGFRLIRVGRCIVGRPVVISPIVAGPMAARLIIASPSTPPVPSAPPTPTPMRVMQTTPAAPTVAAPDYGDPV